MKDNYSLKQTKITFINKTNEREEKGKFFNIMQEKKEKLQVNIID